MHPGEGEEEQQHNIHTDRRIKYAKEEDPVVNLHLLLLKFLRDVLASFLIKFVSRFLVRFLIRHGVYSSTGTEKDGVQVYWARKSGKIQEQN